MAKLQDMFTHARRAASGGNIGFLGRSKGETRPRAAAIVLELTKITAGDAEAAVKAGADGLLFSWDGKDSAQLDKLASEIAAAKTASEEVVSGLHITGGWDHIDHETLTHIKERDIQYLVLPLEAPASLLGQEVKDLEMVVTVPMRSGDMYPLFIRNLTAFDNIAGVLLDFGLGNNINEMTIEEVLQYRAVREAVRFPALIPIDSQLDKTATYTLMALGVQALIISTATVSASVQEQIKSLRSILEDIHEEKKEASSHKTGLTPQESR